MRYETRALSMGPPSNNVLPFLPETPVLVSKFLLLRLALSLFRRAWHLSQGALFVCLFVAQSGGSTTRNGGSRLPWCWNEFANVSLLSSLDVCYTDLAATISLPFGKALPEQQQHRSTCADPVRTGHDTLACIASR